MRVSVWAPTLCQNARVRDDSHFSTFPLRSACGLFCFHQVGEETYDSKTCHDPGQVAMELSWDGYHLSLQEGRGLGIRVKRLSKNVSADAPHPCWGLRDIRAAPLLSAHSASNVLLTVCPGPWSPRLCTFCWLFPLFPTVPRCSEVRYPGPRFQNAVLGRVQRAPTGSSPRRCPIQGCWLELTVHEPMGCTQYAVFKQKHAKQVHMLISWQNVKPEARGYPGLCFLGSTAQFLTSQCLWTL